jgi:demethylmenaquinone methyltransferase/2-methoxy-6-polyprenyl-1,4-benzoquinol methylase
MTKPESAAVNSMFSRIAARYDVANRLLSFGLDIHWRNRLVTAVKLHKPLSILDLATGSGDVAFAIANKLPQTVKITGMDFCDPMLAEARIKQKAITTAENISFQQGDGLDLPILDATYDAVTISFGLRNMADREKSLKEMRRVLKPDGHLFVLEFSQPYAWFKPIYFLYLRYILPTIAGLVTKDREAYVYLNETIEAFPNRFALESEISAAGFTHVKSSPLLFGVVALHEAKR